jgi:hypothetical protein
MDAKKVRKLFYLFPSSFCCCWIRDGKTLDPGFGINIPDPQHGYNQTFLPDGSPSTNETVNPLSLIKSIKLEIKWLQENNFAHA